jgi:F0F1-type ATP synthase assembly protein I
MGRGNNALKYVHFGISFGTTMAVSIYLGFKGGMWLDNRFSTEPFFMLVGILLGVGVTFKNLLDNLKRMDKK